MEENVRVDWRESSMEHRDGEKNVKDCVLTMDRLENNKREILMKVVFFLIQKKIDSKKH